MKILVTGGAGYIGSHTCVEAIKADHEVVVLDNFSNSSGIALDRIAEITGVRPVVVEADLLDTPVVEKLFKEHSFDAVIHFAGFKAVGESVSEPWKYFHNNLVSTLVLLDVMRANNVFNLVFSSSATVYGDPEVVPITESAPLSALNPYGRTKLWIEDMLRDIAAADSRWHFILLRYFNPAGAHESGLIGEDPNGIPNNLMPYITQVAIGKLKELTVFGDDYPTRDGTCIRDYIHVSDLAEGHISALDVIESVKGCIPINLGTGEGYTVLELVHAFERAIGKPLPHKIGPRRPGDSAATFADPSLALELLGWKAKRGIDEICNDAWNWQSKNPNGYQTR